MPPPARQRPLRDAALVLAAILGPVAVFLLALGTRPGLGTALQNPVVALKTVLPALVLGLGLMALARLIRPEATARAALRALAVPALAALGLLGVSALQMPPGRWLADFTPRAIVECAGSILVLAGLPALVATRIFARGASPAPGLSAALAGLVAGAGAATGYSLFCTQDNPFFFVIWYGFAMAGVALLTAGLGRRRFAW